MTRFNISLEQGVDMVVHALENAWGGEMFIPKIPSYRILDTQSICKNCKKEIVGIRPGETYEEMITSWLFTYDLGKYYTILPATPTWKLNEYIKINNATKVEKNFSYNSKNNTEWETIDSLKKLILKYIEWIMK